MDYENSMIQFRLDKVMVEKKIRFGAELARKTGLNENTINNIMRNKVKQVHLETLNKICIALNCLPGDLIEYVPREKEIKKEESK